MNYWYITRSSPGCSWMSEQRTTNGWTAHKCFVIQKKIYKKVGYSLFCNPCLSHTYVTFISTFYFLFLCGSPVTDYPISPHLIPNFFPLFSSTLSCLFPLRSSFQPFFLAEVLPPFLFSFCSYVDYVY